MATKDTVQLPPSPHGCPMDALLRLLSGPWTTYILWTLHSQGPQRFGALKRQVGEISAKVLTERLRMLTGAGLLFRTVEPTIPPQVTYGLTDAGHELLGAFEGLEKLAKKWGKQTDCLPKKQIRRSKTGS